MQLARGQPWCCVVKTARLGDVLYRTACAVAALWATFVFIVTATLSLPDWTIATPIAAVGAVSSGASVAPLGMFYRVVD